MIDPAKGFCERHDARFDPSNPEDVAAHTHPETLTKQQLHDALVAVGYYDDLAWTIADDAFIVSMSDIWEAP